MAVHVLTADFFFRTKIEATADAVGVPVRYATTAAELSADLDGGEPAAEGRLVLLDLNDRALDAAALIRALKARGDPPRIVAFGSHRDPEPLAAARAAGADRVLARSAFSARLPELLVWCRQSIVSTEGADAPDPARRDEEA